MLSETTLVCGELREQHALQYVLDNSYYQAIEALDTAHEMYSDLFNSSNNLDISEKASRGLHRIRYLIILLKQWADIGNAIDDAHLQQAQDSDAATVANTSSRYSSADCAAAQSTLREAHISSGLSTLYERQTELKKRIQDYAFVLQDSLRRRNNV